MKEARVRTMLPETPLATAFFEDRKEGVMSQEHGRFLEAGEEKATDFLLLESPMGTQS